MTNSHVINDNPDERDTLLPEQAVLKSEFIEEQICERRVKEILWRSPKEELDTILARLDRPIDKTIELYKVTERLPLADGEQRVYIIGYPRGKGLSFSLQDNVYLGHQDHRLHYRTPTDKGNSGSPVFNQQWQLIGLHHAGDEKMPTLDGSDTYPANEGIWIKSIIERIATEL